MSKDTFIGNDHPQDGREWDCQCARCGSSMTSKDCGACGGDGITGPGELYEQDPLWYDEDDYEPCHQCGGDGSWMLCISSPEWCEDNPIAGRESIPRHTPEWFVVERSPNSSRRLPKRNLRRWSSCFGPRPRRMRTKHTP